jgi:hypothetical protein
MGLSADRLVLPIKVVTGSIWYRMELVAEDKFRSQK